MFGFDWPELIIIGIVALIFIGPEDLPDMFRQLGRFTAKLRQMSREFSRAMDQAAKDTGVSDVARDLKTSTSAKSLGLDKVREAADKFEKWDPIKNAAKPSATMPARTLMPPPMPATPATATPATPSSAVVEAETTIADEVDDDMAALAEDEAHDAAAAQAAAQPTIHGPATRALYDKQALRAKVLAEQTEKLKAIEAGTYIAEPAAVAAVVAATPAVVEPAPIKRSTKPKVETAKMVAKTAAKADPVKAVPVKAVSAKVGTAKVDASSQDSKADAPKKTSRKKKADAA